MPSSSAIFMQTSGTSSLATNRTPTSVTVHPVALFGILDHFLRRTDSQDRVIGTLLGTRSDREVEVRNSFPVLHSETEEVVAVDMDYHRAMFDMYQKVNPKEVIVGWYSTGSNLNTYSALIQNFYAQETGQYPAIHLAMNTGAQSDEPSFKAYVSSPVGVVQKPENCVFSPIPCEIRLQDGERSGLDLLVAATKSASHVASPQQDLEVLEQSLQNVLQMLDRVLGYVKSVLSGEVQGNIAVGRYLLDTLSTAAPALEKGKLEHLFNSHLQDTLMISYLGNLVRSQVEVSSRLTLVT